MREIYWAKPTDPLTPDLKIRDSRCDWNRWIGAAAFSDDQGLGATDSLEYVLHTLEFEPYAFAQCRGFCAITINAVILGVYRPEPMLRNGPLTQSRVRLVLHTVSGVV